MSEFPQNLDNLLKKNNITRKDLAGIIGVSPSAVSSWFNRSYGGVALDTLKKISEYFNVTLDYLVYGDGDEIGVTRAFSDEEIEILKALAKQSKEAMDYDLERLKYGKYSDISSEV